MVERLTRSYKGLETSAKVSGGDALLSGSLPDMSYRPIGKVCDSS